jgi:hypothetical protein
MRHFPLPFFFIANVRAEPVLQHNFASQTPRSSDCCGMIFGDFIGLDGQHWTWTGSDDFLGYRTE